MHKNCFYFCSWCIHNCTSSPALWSDFLWPSFLCAMSQRRCKCSNIWRVKFHCQCTLYQWVWNKRVWISFLFRVEFVTVVYQFTSAAHLRVTKVEVVYIFQHELFISLWLYLYGKMLKTYLLVVSITYWRLLGFREIKPISGACSLTHLCSYGNP